LNVVVLVDASRSMATGTPQKFEKAVEMTAALALVALSGGDQVLVGVFQGGELTWSQRCTSQRGLPGLLAWLQAVRPEGTTDIQRVALKSHKFLRPDGLLIVISDWMTDDVNAALSSWATLGQEIVAIQVVDADDEDPIGIGAGPVQFTDLETTEVVVGSFDEAIRTRYRAAFNEWRDALREAVSRNQGRWFQARTDEDLEHVILHSWRVQGLIR